MSESGFGCDGNNEGVAGWCQKAIEGQSSVRRKQEIQDLGIIKKRELKGKGNQISQSRNKHHQTYLDNIAIAVLSNPEDVEVGGWR